MTAFLLGINIGIAIGIAYWVLRNEEKK